MLETTRHIFQFEKVQNNIKNKHLCRRAESALKTDLKKFSLWGSVTHQSHTDSVGKKEKEGSGQKKEERFVFGEVNRNKTHVYCKEC